MGIDIFIHEDEEDNHYILTWWNCKKRNECNAFGIKNASALDMREKYYMRYAVNKLKYDEADDDKTKDIDWYWYDNDSAKYVRFSDYMYLNQSNMYKEGLLHKQIEAIYLSNIDSNFSWNLFDSESHSFNGTQINHLRPALESKLRKSLSGL